MMKHFKLFEEFTELYEGQIHVFPPGNPFQSEGSMTWPGVHKWLPEYSKDGRGIIIGADFNYDFYIDNPKYKSVPSGTIVLKRNSQEIEWDDPNLPFFTDDHKDYDEVEYDYIGIVPNPAKETREPWIKIADKDNNEFLIPPFLIVDILKGGSVRDGIFPGGNFLIDKQRARIYDYVKGVVKVKLQDGDFKEYPLKEWRNKRFLDLDESENTEL